ncbi:MAG: hypothetical protein COA94_05030 [Rickettsiales bacterium]|nr:MAG: hypothetical protein COA94_05030 [Rickettsiales bacterium]
MKAHELIKLHEGLELKPYRCTAGELTIGYGINLDAGITEEEADYMLDNRVRSLTTQLHNIDFWIELSGVRRAVLIDMAYNLGLSGLLKFRRMLAAMEVRDFDKAAIEMENSRWFNQVGNRSKRLQKMMITGDWWTD